MEKKILLLNAAVDMISTVRDDLEKPVTHHLVLLVSFIKFYSDTKKQILLTQIGGMKRKCDASLMW